MLFSALFLASSAALAAALNPTDVCQKAGACLRISRFDAVEPALTGSREQTSIEFHIRSDDTKFGASATCETDWASNTENWPKQPKTCKGADFKFYFNNFHGDIDTEFTIEVTYGYHDPSVAGPSTPGKLPQDHVLAFAKGNVNKDVLSCLRSGDSKSCSLLEGEEILLPIYARTA